GRHRHAVHGKSRTGTRSRTTRPAATTEVGVVTTLHEAASQVGGKGVPKAPDLAAAFGRGLSVASLMAAGWAVDSDPVIKQHTAADPAAAAVQTDGLVQLLSISDASARKIMTPVSILLAPSSL